MEKNFISWYKQNLTIGAFPYRINNMFEASDYDIVINVSDEWYIDVELKIRESYVSYYWFPMNEVKKDIGLNSIYGSIIILKHAEKRNLKVYLHCHAGVNRSRIVADAYYFLRTNDHIETDNDLFINKLIAACTRCYLPPKKEMENFLRKISEIKRNSLGGVLDECKIDSIKNF